MFKPFLNELQLLIDLLGLVTVRPYPSDGVIMALDLPIELSHL
jgi:hypothetical protein